MREDVIKVLEKKVLPRLRKSEENLKNYRHILSPYKALEHYLSNAVHYIEELLEAEKEEIDELECNILLDNAIKEIDCLTRVAFKVTGDVTLRDLGAILDDILLPIYEASKNLDRIRFVLMVNECFGEKRRQGDD